MASLKAKHPHTRELLVVLPVLSALLLLPFWPIATMQGLVITNDISVSDMANQSHPLRHFLSRELHAGRLPLWLPEIYMGYPIQAEGQVGAFYPPNLLLFGLLPSRTALNLSVLFPFLVAAFSAYALARTLGASIWPSLSAALAYALGGFYIAHLKHMSMVHTACWLPLAWLLIELGLHRGRRFLLVVGVVWAVQWLAGMPQMAYYSVGAGLLYYLGRATQARRLRSTAGPLVLALGLSFGLAAIQLWPTAELTALSARSGGTSFEYASRFNYNLASLRTFVYPYANGDPGAASYQIKGLFWEDYAYIGLIPLIAGLAGGVWLARRGGPTRILVTLALATFVLALGSNTPVFRLAWSWLPGMKYFRFPQRLLVVTTLCLVLTAALFLTRCQAWFVRPRAQSTSGSWLTRSLPRGETLLGITVVSLIVADLYFYHIRQNAYVSFEPWYAPPETVQGMSQQRADLDGLWEADLSRVLTIGGVSTFQDAYEQAAGWQGDLQPYVAQRDFLLPNLNVLYDISSATGYVNLTPVYLMQLWGQADRPGLVQQAVFTSGNTLLVSPDFARLLGLYNVRHLITHMPLRAEGFELLGVYESGAHLYENQRVLPRAYAVPTYSLARNVPSALNRISSPGFDPSEEVVLLDTPTEHSAALDGDGFASAIRITRYESQHVTVEAQVSRSAFLVLSDLYYPGWEATVDGLSTVIYQANGCVRSVAVDQGLHVIDFRFKPKSLRYGAMLSGLCGLASIIIFRLTQGGTSRPLQRAKGKPKVEVSPDL